MALSDQQREKIESMLAVGGISKRKIAKEVGCSEKTVRNVESEMELENSALSALADLEKDNIIMGKAIEKKKSALSPHLKSAYDELLLTKLQAENLALNVNNALLMKLYDMIEDGTKDEKLNVGDGMQSIEPIRYAPSDMAHIAKAAQIATDSLGITERHAKTQIGIQNNTDGQRAKIVRFDEI